jgi:hypothetical protein
MFEKEVRDDFESGDPAGGYHLGKIWEEKGTDVLVMIRAIGEDGHVGTYSNVLQLGGGERRVANVQDEAQLI